MKRNLKAIPLSFLDLATLYKVINRREDASNESHVCPQAEKIGYHRTGLADTITWESIASAALPFSSSCCSKAPQRSVGSGGIMCPTMLHSIIAEQFGTLESLYPGRIDLA